MAARRLRGLLIGIILHLIIITFGPLLLLYLFFTSLNIGGRRITPFLALCCAERTLVPTPLA
jgi:hypothetical protein